MGLRFRRSISLFPGVKLNFGTTGMSVSTGVSGFRKTYHTSGRETTSVGIPGTGLYYVNTKTVNKKSYNRSTSSTSIGTVNKQLETPQEQSSVESQTIHDIKANSSADNISLTTWQTVKRESPKQNSIYEIVQLDPTALKSIHKTSDDSIDWTEVLVSLLPPDDTYNKEMWQYYHKMAAKILSGDIDTYLQLIYEVNPLDDLLVYGGNFEFGTDDPNKIEVEFTINCETLLGAKAQMSISNYNNLVQDYACSICIRIARDMFALLPISHTIVHTVFNGETIISVDLDRTNLSKVKFGYIDPSDTLLQFKHNMKYNEETGFDPVVRLE